MDKVGQKDMRTKEDENGNAIGDGTEHMPYDIENFGGYGIRHIVEEAATSESVYVTYIDTQSGKSAKVRFSGHISNDVKEGLVIDGRGLNVRDEILYRLGHKSKEWCPFIVAYVCKEAVGKKRIANFEVGPMTLDEILALPVGTDINECKGKIAKGSNWLIKNDKVIAVERGGRWIYK